ncbi:MAG: hypothetical protein ACOH2F_05925 [Cellulomonas sp.]
MTLLSQVSTQGAAYLSWSWFSISVPNLIVVGVMIALFVLAVVIPFPRDDHDAREDS